MTRPILGQHANPEANSASTKHGPRKIRKQMAAQKRSHAVIPRNAMSFRKGSGIQHPTSQLAMEPCAHLICAQDLFCHRLSRVWRESHLQ